MFAKILNGAVVKYPYTVEDLRRDNPSTSFPKKVPTATMAEYNMYPIGYQAAPAYNPLTHRLKHSDVPSLVEGEWKLTKTVVELTDQQVSDRTAAKAKEMRAKRDALIASTDYFALTDVAMSDEMISYRQALRDITNLEAFPYLSKDDWPTKPV